jgi:NAD(P)-dependent dehydrogenase (short-subunit alcohol dehydrogenase family)
MNLEPGPLLEGRIAVVSGAGHILGRRIAEAFGAHGATVVIADRDSEQLSETADAIAAAGGKVIPVAGDLSRRADVRRLAELGGEVDILVNHHDPSVAGHPPLLESDEDEWAGRYELNLKPVLLCCRAMIPGMISRARGGSVINLIAGAGQRHALGAAFEGGVTGLTGTLARELWPHRIRVNAIRGDGPADEDIRSEGVAGVALFLASDLSALVTGTVIPAGGGATGPSQGHG